MNLINFLKIISALCFCGIFIAAEPAKASFHLMQIEQVIGGVNGDTTAQAIQLRMRASFQNQVQQSRLFARDATGSNPLLLIDIASSVPNFSLGSRVLITTPNFANYTSIPLVSDFTMTPIPSSYLAAGQITFENDFSGNLWGLNFGGAGYTGPTTGLVTNDANGDFGPAFGGPLPSTSTSALQFQGIASAPSTTNLADYALTAGAAVFTNNAGTSFTVVGLETSADFDEDTDVDGLDFLTWQKGFGAAGGLGQGDANNSGTVDGADLTVWEEQFGQLGGTLAATAAVPEPQSIYLLLSGMLAVLGRRRHP